MKKKCLVLQYILFDHLDDNRKLYDSMDANIIFYFVLVAAPPGIPRY